jgi:hypothetical protein
LARVLILFAPGSAPKESLFNLFSANHYLFAIFKSVQWIKIVFLEMHRSLKNGGSIIYGKVPTTTVKRGPHISVVVLPHPIDVYVYVCILYLKGLHVLHFLLSCLSKAVYLVVY